MKESSPSDGGAAGHPGAARGKRLRGTRLDPFGRTEIRRYERALPGEYLEAMNAVYAQLTRTA